MSPNDVLDQYGIEDVQNADTDEESFCAVIKNSYEFLKVKDKELAKAIGVSRPTVTRWRGGQCAPHLAMRKLVYETICQMVKS